MATSTKCVEEMKNVLQSACGLVGKPVADAKIELGRLRDQGRKVMKDCSAETKGQFEDACKGIEKLIASSQNQPPEVIFTLQQAANVLYEEALKKMNA